MNCHYDELMNTLRTLTIKGKGPMEVFILKSAQEPSGRHSEVDRRKSNSARALRAFSMLDNYHEV